MRRFVDIGKFDDRLYLMGNAYMPIYYLKGDTVSALTEAGVTFMGPIVVQQIKELSLKEPSYIFLTHSHYDHLGAVPYYKKSFPEVKVAGSPLIERVMSSERAVELIRKLNYNDLKAFDLEDSFKKEDVEFEPFNLDIEVKEGDQFELGGITVQIFETPGHTKDAISYYVPEIKGICFGEAGGVPELSGKIQPEFTSSVENYIASLKKLENLELEIICLAHGGIIYGEDARGYIKRSLESAIQFKERIINYYKELGDIEAVVEKILSEDYKGGQISQPEVPYRINLEAMVKKVTQESKTKEELNVKG